MWGTKTVRLLPLLLTLVGCATYTQISGVQLGGQKKIYQSGKEVMFSQQQHTVSIAFSPEAGQAGRRASFTIAIRNGSQHEVVFSAANITACAADRETGECAKPLKVYGYRELAREERKREKWAAVGAALQGMADSMNASNVGYSQTTGTYSGSSYSSNGTTSSEHGTYSGTTYDPAKAQAARDAAEAKSRERIKEIDEQARANLQRLSSTFLRKQTVYPGDWYGGGVKIQMPDAADTPTAFLVTVVVDGESHVFRFTQSRAND